MVGWLLVWKEEDGERFALVFTDIFTREIITVPKDNFNNSSHSDPRFNYNCPNVDKLPWMHILLIDSGKSFERSFLWGVSEGLTQRGYIFILYLLILYHLGVFKYIHVLTLKYYLKRKHTGHYIKECKMLNYFLYLRCKIIFRL